MRQPTFYITHGGGPCFWMEFAPPIGPHGFDGLKQNLTDLPSRLPERPKAYLVITAHWEDTHGIAVSAADHPGMIYDYAGFPEHTYHLKHPAPGDPALAQEVVRLITEAGLAAHLNDDRGFDHGTFVPMMVINPEADIPTVTMSLSRSFDPAFHLKVGKALQPLRDQGVVIIGSGSSFHNLRTYFHGGDNGARQFDDWLTETVTQVDASDRHDRLVEWLKAPGARSAHPREEHLLPLMVAVGAAGDDVGERDFHDMIAGKPFSGYIFRSPDNA